MKTKCCLLWMYTAVVAVALVMASCGNSQKKRERAAERERAARAMDTVTVYESETVIVAVDSLAPDSAAIKKNVVTPGKN